MTPETEKRLGWLGPDTVDRTVVTAVVEWTIGQNVAGAGSADCVLVPVESQGADATELNEHLHSRMKSLSRPPGKLEKTVGISARQVGLASDSRAEERHVD